MVAIERVLFQVNVRTAIPVAQAAGIAMAEAVAAGCEVVEYSPNQVKQAVAGVGGASKDQMERMVQTLLGHRPAPPTRRRRRRGRAGAVPPRPRADAAAAWPRRWPDDRLAAGHAARSGRRRGHRRGRRASATASPSAPPRRCRSATSAHEVFCWVHHHQREDAVTLYGFATKDERACFEALLGAHGVGPGPGAGDPVDPHADRPGAGPRRGRPRRAVPRARRRQEDGARACSSTSSRASRSPTSADGPAPGTAPTTDGPATARADVRDALAGLGYSDAEVREVMADLPDDGDAGALLRDALQRLAAARR